MNLKCRCGGIFRPQQDLEGLFCDACGKQISGDTDSIMLTEGYDPSVAYQNEKLKNVKGVSMSSITIGTASKGSINVYFPPYLSLSEQKQLVDAELELLAYTKQRVNELGLDIYSSRKKAEE